MQFGILVGRIRIPWVSFVAKGALPRLLVLISEISDRVQCEFGSYELHVHGVRVRVTETRDGAEGSES